MSAAMSLMPPRDSESDADSLAENLGKLSLLGNQEGVAQIFYSTPNGWLLPCGDDSDIEVAGQPLFQEGKQEMKDKKKTSSGHGNVQ